MDYRGLNRRCHGWIFHDRCDSRAVYPGSLGRRAGPNPAGLHRHRSRRMWGSRLEQRLPGNRCRPVWLSTVILTFARPAELGENSVIFIPAEVLPVTGEKVPGIADQPKGNRDAVWDRAKRCQVRPVSLKVRLAVIWDACAAVRDNGDAVAPSTSHVPAQKHRY